MADIGSLFEITQLLNAIFMVSIVFALIGVGFWAIQYLTPKAKGAITSPFKGGLRGRRKRRRTW